MMLIDAMRRMIECFDAMKCEICHLQQLNLNYEMALKVLAQKRELTWTQEEVDMAIKDPRAISVHGTGVDLINFSEKGGQS
jgi:tRNA/tmRNA/rRNA uracil-C5-methylase (TrmA/RlmC/RlmD family)